MNICLGSTSERIHPLNFVSSTVTDWYLGFYLPRKGRIWKQVSFVQAFVDQIINCTRSLLHFPTRASYF